MPTPMPSQRSLPSGKPPSSSGSDTKNYIIFILLLATIGAGGYAWTNINGRLQLLEAKNKAPAVNAGPARGTPGGNFNGQGATTFNATPGGNFGATGATTGRGGRGRGGASAANIANMLGLAFDENQTAQLDALIQQRSQLVRDARAAGEDPTAAAAELDAQLGAIIGPENMAQVQQLLNGGNRGRGGAGGAGFGGGAGGAGGFGGGGAGGPGAAGFGN